MGIVRYLIGLTLVICMCTAAQAQETEKEIIPPGMEVRIIGQNKLIVPEDAQVKQEGGFFVVESIDTYMARSLSAMKKRIDTLEKNQNILNQRIEQLEIQLNSEEKQQQL